MYRIYDIKQKKQINNIIIDGNGNLFLMKQSKGLFGKVKISAIPVLENDYIIQRYTGVKDKNNIMIFEGDLVKLEIPTFTFFDSKKLPCTIVKIGIVMYSDKMMRFVITYNDDKKSIVSLFDNDISSVEVIGDVTDSRMVNEIYNLYNTYNNFGDNYGK